MTSWRKDVSRQKKKSSGIQYMKVNQLFIAFHLHFVITCWISVKLFHRFHLQTWHERRKATKKSWRLVVCRLIGFLRRSPPSSSLSGKPSEPSSGDAMERPETVVPERSTLHSAKWPKRWRFRFSDFGHCTFCTSTFGDLQALAVLYGFMNLHGNAWKMIPTPTVTWNWHELKNLPALLMRSCFFLFLLIPVLELKLVASDLSPMLSPPRLVVGLVGPKSSTSSFKPRLWEADVEALYLEDSWVHDYAWLGGDVCMLMDLMAISFWVQDVLDSHVP